MFCQFSAYCKQGKKKKSEVYFYQIASERHETTEKVRKTSSRCYSIQLRLYCPF